MSSEAVIEIESRGTVTGQSIRLYQAVCEQLSHLQSPFLLAIRLYWGWQFAQTGWGKLNHLAKITGFFANLGIPFPVFNAHFVSGLEFFGGLLLISSLGSFRRMLLLQSSGTIGLDNGGFATSGPRRGTENTVWILEATASTARSSLGPTLSGFVPGKANYVIIYGEGCFNSKRQARWTVELYTIFRQLPWLSWWVERTLRPDTREGSELRVHADRVGDHGVMCGRAFALKRGDEMADRAFIALPDYREYSTQEMKRRAEEFHAEIRRRRTVREFSDRHVPREIIEDCVLAAGTAPSGANMQPWHFVVVSNPAVKKKIRDAAEEEEREFYRHKAPQEWLDSLSPRHEEQFLETEVQHSMQESILESALFREISFTSETIQPIGENARNVSGNL